MNKRISLQDAVSKVKDGMTVMVGGFLAAGSPIAILDE
ncbi:MAG: branched-chain amino acid dehydrogenase, partial [Bacteroidales bacterium]|nr:branched-chain amino acid dehydrogenase [Bacteroidales bacterium]MBR4089061.1 branched-chain amino acid dehydrogenase [Bacteroidales bacterium]